MFAIVFASVASVCWIYTYISLYSNEWVSEWVAFACHRQHLWTITTYCKCFSFFVARNILAAVQLEIEWKTKTSAHEILQTKHSHRSQSMVDAYVLVLSLSSNRFGLLYWLVLYIFWCTCVHELRCHIDKHWLVPSSISFSLFSNSFFFQSLSRYLSYSWQI